MSGVDVNPVVGFIPRSWDQDGEQLRDWLPVHASEVDGRAITVEHWYELDGSHFGFERADGLVARVTELGVADGFLALSGQDMRRRLDALDGAEFVRVVKDMGASFGAAIFREYTNGNPFRAELRRVE